MLNQTQIPGAMFQLTVCPFSLPSSSLGHGQTKLCSPALALEKALCSWVLTLSALLHIEIPSFMVWSLVRKSRWMGETHAVAEAPQDSDLLC